MNKKNIIIGCLGGLLLASVAAGIYMSLSDNARISELELQLDALQQQEKLSAIDRRVSKQMEEIAYGQQTLSEERRREAELQTEIAQAATLRSEAERRNALQAQASAESYAKEAMESYALAERQRAEADVQRRQAEHAKLQTDTLNYISLGRTLGSQSYAVYRTGDKELGTMLAYASYLFTNNNGGSLYSSSVFPALTQAANSQRYWNAHVGSVSRIELSADGKGMLTISTYGELYVHNIVNGELSTHRLLRDKNYCFRDLHTSKAGKSYAVSHTGHLVIVNQGRTKVITLENITKPFRLEPMNDGQQLLIIGENSVGLYDIASDKVISTRRLNFKVTCSGRRDYKPLLFDNRGHMHLVNSIDDMTDEKVPVSGNVTTFASSKHEHLAAYGMGDGTIWLIYADGTPRRLAGHLSQVTKMKFNGKRLYSSSYDGKMLFWMVGSSQIKPITLFQSGSWLTDFNFSNDKNYIWTGESNGTITEYLISLPIIGERIRQNVKRNFTQEEWNYYVGKSIPYRKLINEN